MDAFFSLETNVYSKSISTYKTNNKQMKYRFSFNENAGEYCQDGHA
jgi:hypothetical protein